MRRIASLLCAAVLAVAGACGGNDEDATLDDIRDAIEEGNLEPSGPADEAAALPDACALVTEDDAEALFGEPAERAEPTAAIDLGSSCVWQNVEHDRAGRVAHLLLVSVFDGEEYYDTSAGEPIDGLGAKASVAIGDGLGEGVDVQFVQDGWTVTIAYSTVNIGADDAVIAADRADEVIGLARQASARM